MCISVLLEKGSSVYIKDLKPKVSWDKEKKKITEILVLNINSKKH